MARKKPTLICARCLRRFVNKWRNRPKYCSRTCYFDTVPRFWAHVERTETCWRWTGATTGHFGHGVLTVNHKQWKAHRYAWTLAHGPIPDGMAVLHHCDEPSCVRVDHLFLGTQTDNMRDKVAKSRQARGERSGPSKLTAEQVQAIRRDPRTQVQIANDYGITQAAVSSIRRRKNWRWL